MAMMLIGNKVDEVGGLQNAALARYRSLMQFRSRNVVCVAFCSAKRRRGVEAFDEVARAAYDKLTRKKCTATKEEG